MQGYLGFAPASKPAPADAYADFDAIFSKFASAEEVTGAIKPEQEADEATPDAAAVPEQVLLPTSTASNGAHPFKLANCCMDTSQLIFTWCRPALSRCHQLHLLSKRRSCTILHQLSPLAEAVPSAHSGTVVEACTFDSQTSCPALHLLPATHQIFSAVDLLLSIRNMMPDHQTAAAHSCAS